MRSAFLRAGSENGANLPRLDTHHPSDPARADLGERKGRVPRVLLPMLRNNGQGLFEMECKVKWIDGVSFVAETESGHALVMDGAPEGGGRNLGPRPMEMVLLGTGGCSAYDVVVILKKSGQEISDCWVELKAERAASDPKVFRSIHMHYVLCGKNLKQTMVESAIKLSHKKYCSASIMLGKTASITHDYEIRVE